MYGKDQRLEMETNHRAILTIHVRDGLSSIGTDYGTRKKVASST